MKKNFPAIPTEFKEGFELNGRWIEAGWYGVRINEKGLESMTGLEVKHPDFDTCLLACNLHNETACGMSVVESAQLYAQQRCPGLFIQQPKEA